MAWLPRLSSANRVLLLTTGRLSTLLSSYSEKEYIKLTPYYKIQPDVTVNSRGNFKEHTIVGGSLKHRFFGQFLFLKKESHTSTYRHFSPCSTWQQTKTQLHTSQCTSCVSKYGMNSCVLDSTSWGEGPVTCWCEHGNETSVHIISEKLFR